MGIQVLSPTFLGVLKGFTEACKNALGNFRELQLHFWIVNRTFQGFSTDLGVFRGVLGDSRGRPGTFLGVS